MDIPLQPHIRKFNVFYEKHEHKISIVFFICGFLFDMVMLERIDSWKTIGQQGLYLAVILIVLAQMFHEQAEPEIDTRQMFVLKRWYYDYRTPLIHFLYGTLLNGYTIFFFKSSSLIVSFVFMVVMVLLLVANESHRFKKSGLTFKFALLSLCLFCYFAYVTPVLVGYMGVLVFLFSVLLGSLPLVLLGWWVQLYRAPLFERAKSQILLPTGLVLLVFLSLYLVKLIPPVPLSIPFIGVYHSVERTAEGYKVAHERPWWRVWQNGDQDFHAQRGDKVFVFFRIFSPTHFSDQVALRWYWKENKAGWVMQDSVPIKIMGGRDEGFRGFGAKANYQPGEWRVQVETSDGREIGRVYFTLDIAPDEPRTFIYETM